MQSSKMLAKIKTLKHPIFQTRDIVALSNQSTTTISKSLARLAKDNHLIRLHKGLWAIPENIEPFMLPEHLTAPFPSYISLQSALYHHGMIEQIPDTVYAVSISRTKIFSTPIAKISIHHLPPALFFGYDTIGKNAVKIATPEKALFDFFYLQPAKTRLFSNLPELEIPHAFNRKIFKQWLNKIKSPQRRIMLQRLFDLLVRQ
jgi:predicted transcriptional regulator of viral defense system